MKLRTLIIIIVLILVAAGIVFYFLSRPGAQRPAPSAQTGVLPNATTQPFPGSGNSQGGNGGSSTAALAGTSGTFGIVSNDPTLDYFVDGQNDATLIEPNGSIETIANGKTSVLSSTTIPNVASASFSHDGRKILVSSGSQANPKTSVFDVAAKSWLSLPSGMQSPVWSPSGYQVAYLNGGSSGGETIFVTTISATSVKTATLETLTMEDSVLRWPNKNTIIIADRPSAFTVGSALSFDIPTGTVTPLVVEYPGMEAAWSGTVPMTGLVFSGNSGYQGGNLSLIGTGGTPQALTFATLPSKCVFNDDVTTSTQTLAAASSTKARPSSTASSSAALTTLITATTTLNLYCAVPRDQATFGIARLPDEYDQRIFFTADDFYKINVASGTLSTVFSDQTQTLDATDLKIANGILFFVNRYDQKLYAIKLAISD